MAPGEIVLNKTDTELELTFGTTRSGLPSRFISVTAIALGLDPVPKSCFGVKLEAAMLVLGPAIAIANSVANDSSAIKESG